MKRLLIAIFAVLILLPVAFIVFRIWRVASLSSEERAIMAMDQNANIKTRFWGEVVDQDGNPVANARVSYAMTGIDPNWALTRAKQRGTRVEGETTTDQKGLFEIEIAGNNLVFNSISIEDFDWLFEEDPGEMLGKPFGWNRSFRLAINGHAGPYLPDKNSPAIFVLVRKGVHEVHVKPSRGSVDNNAGKVRTNVPVRPEAPSIKGVRFVGSPTTQP